MDTPSPIPFPLRPRAAAERHTAVVVEPMVIENTGRQDAGDGWILLAIAILSIAAHVLIAVIWRLCL